MSESELDSYQKKIIIKMKELEHFPHDQLLIYAAVASLELLDKKINGATLPEGFTLDTYAQRMLLKGAELGATFRAKKNAEIALEKDPRQKALKEIEEKFHKVSNQFKRYGYGAEFIRKMANEYPDIKDQDTIARLVTRLKKQNLPSS